MILQHVLVFFLIVVTPLWDWYEIPRLKASTDPGKKVRFYGKIAVASWICAVLAALTVGALAEVTILREDCGGFVDLRGAGGIDGRGYDGFHDSTGRLRWLRGSARCWR